jgi:PhnB protein
MATANPYLFFGGDANDAMEFYRDVFGAELSTMSYDSMPGEDGVVPPDRAGRLMHADLTLGDLRILASDLPDGYERSKFGNPEICINATTDEEAAAREWFESLSAGGTVRQPLEKMFWGDWFGQLDDKFGVQWMVNISGAAQSGA